MEFDKLIEKTMSEEVNKRKVIQILSESIKNKCDEKHISERLYREIYGGKLIPEMCEEMISMLGNGIETGAKWSLDDVKEVARRLDYDLNNKPYTLEELRAIMTKEYYEHSIPLKKSNINLESTGWGRMADYYFTGINPKGKIVDDYFELKEYSK